MKYILVGISTLRKHYLEAPKQKLMVISSSNNKKEIRKLATKHRNECGGLMMIINSETGNELE